MSDLGFIGHLAQAVHNENCPLRYEYVDPIQCPSWRAHKVYASKLALYPDIARYVHVEAAARRWVVDHHTPPYDQHPEEDGCFRALEELFA